MRKYGLVIVLGAIMAIALVVFLFRYHTPSIQQMTFTEQVRGMDIKLFYDDKDDIYYLFIPAYTDKEHISIELPDDVNVRFSSNGNDFGNSLAKVPLNEPVGLTITSSTPPYRELEKHTIELLQSENLTTLFIETGEGGVEAIHLNKASQTQATIVAIDSKGTPGYSGRCALAGRGNATWGQPKNPYNIKFSQPTTFISKKDSAKTWCLLANYGDDSQIRNAISYYIADEMGIPYTSGVEFVTLYINGKYCGLYDVTTKQNYLSDIGKKIEAVFERTAKYRIYDRISDYGFYFRTRYGDADKICRAVNDFEEILYCDTASYQRFSRYADMHMIARKFVVDAICANYDLKLSQYYILNEEGKISPICAWDYDNSFGISTLYPDYSFNQIAISHPWYNELFKKKEFRQEILSIFSQYSPLLQDSVKVYIDSVCGLIANDWMSNNVRWRNYVSPWKSNKFLKREGYDFETLQGHEAYIKDFLGKRIQFLSEYWSAPEQFYQITFDNDGTRLLLNTIALYYHKGDTLTEDNLPKGLLSMPDEGFFGWYTNDGKPITDVKVVSKNMSFDEKKTSKGQTTKLLEKIVHKGGLLIFIVVFGCLVLWLFIKTIIVPIREAGR